MGSLIALTAAEECVISDGGIYQTQLVDGSEIASVTFDAQGNITAIVMNNPDMWETYNYDDDDTANYSQNGVRTNNKIEYTQNSFFKYAGVTEAKIYFANEIAPCCKLVAIHRSNSGVNYVQGLEQLKDGTWGFTKKKLKATPNVLTDTGAGEDRVELNLDSTGRRLSPLTALTSAAIEAL